MSPLRWMQCTGPHWRVILEEVIFDALILVGAIDGTGRKYLHVNIY